MAVYFPSTLFDLRTMTLPLSRRQRLEMEQAIEAAISLLDAADGDHDIEDDELGDDPIDAQGEAVEYTKHRLEYGIDQTCPLGFSENALTQRRTAPVPPLTTRSVGTRLLRPSQTTSGAGFKHA